MSERGYVDAAPGRRTAAGALLIGGYHPSKLWVGGLPDSATLADLEDCFGQIGPCSCTLKRGFGFVEYNDPNHAKEAVAKYHEGHFLGAQIKVELSLARAPDGSSKGGSEPPTPYSNHSVPPPLLGAPPSSTAGCFVCGSPDHWARECPDSDKMPLRNPPGSDRPSDSRKPMWINGPPKESKRGGRNGGPPRGPPPPRNGPPGPPGPPGPYGNFPPPPNYPPRYDMPPFERPPPPGRFSNGPPPPPGYGARVPDPYYDRPPPLQDGYAPYPPPDGRPYPPAPFERAPLPPPSGPYPPRLPLDDPYADRYGPPPPLPGRSPVMPPAPYGHGRNGSLDARPPYGNGPPPPLDPYDRPPPTGAPFDGPLPPPGAYDPRDRDDRGGPPNGDGGRYAPYPPRGGRDGRDRERDRDLDERGRPGSAYGDRSPRMERRRSLSPRRGDRNGYGPPPPNGDYYSRPPPPSNGYGRPVSPPNGRYPPPPNDHYGRR